MNHNQQALKEMQKILIENNSNNNNNNNHHHHHQRHQQLTGQQIFTQYYTSHLPRFINLINQSTESLPSSQIILYLQVLANVQKIQEITKLIQTIKEEKILQINNVHVKALYLKVLIKHQLSYIGALDKLYENLCKQEESNNNNKQDKQSIIYQHLQAAKTIISIPSYPQVLPQRLSSKCLQTFISHMSYLQPLDHWMIIKHIYIDLSGICKEYIELLTQRITKSFKQNKSQELHVPLILKTIKYRSKLRLDNEIFSEIIQSYPEKFNTVFKQKKFNKQIFLSLITKQGDTFINQDYRQEFGSFIYKTFLGYENSQTIDEQQLLRNLKLIIKYGNDVKVNDINKIIDILARNIYDRFKEVASDQLKYYIGLTILTYMKDDYVKMNKVMLSKLIKQVIQIYHKRCLSPQNLQSLWNLINLQYQLTRNQLQQHFSINIFQYNYTTIQLPPRIYSYLFYLMKKNLKSPSSYEQIKKILTDQKKVLYKFLSNGKFSMKVVYTLLDVLVSVKFQDDYVYVDLEKCIAFNMKKGLEHYQKKKGNDIPLPKDIQFLKNKFVINQKCSGKFAKFIRDAQTNYQFIHQYIREYLEKAQNWENMRENQKRKRNENKYKQNNNNNSSNYKNNDSYYKTNYNNNNNNKINFNNSNNKKFNNQRQKERK